MKVVIPTDLSEITLSQYKRYKKVVLDNQDDEVYLCIQMVAIFCNLSIERVMTIPSLDFAEIVEQIAKVLDQEPKLTHTFKMGGVHYGFIPNIEKVSLSEHADIDTCFGNDDLIELMLSIAYRPIKRKAGDFYEIEPYSADESKAELFKDVPMSIVKGFTLFFWSLNKELLQITLSSIPKIAKAEGLNLEEAFQNAGGGINLLSDLQEKIGVEFQTWGKNLYLNHSRYYLT
jgi:hypothetical protein